MTSINETVEQTMRGAGYGAYMQYATPVVTALVDREQQIVGHLIEYADREGFNVERVRSAFAEAGMHMPTPTAVPAEEMEAADVGSDLTATLARIEQALTRQDNTLQGLSEFARRHGYAG